MCERNEREKMAYIRKVKPGMWTVAIRKLNQKPQYKSFQSKATATAWAKEVETLMDKKQFEDLGVAEEDVFKPEKTAIQDCINVVEQERDEFEEYLDQMY